MCWWVDRGLPAEFSGAIKRGVEVCVQMFAMVHPSVDAAVGALSLTSQVSGDIGAKLRCH